MDDSEGHGMAAPNIKNEETYRLARELARIRGQGLTEVVTQSLRESLEREQGRAIREDRTEYWLAKGREIRSRMKEPFLSSDHGDLLYDDRGLPN